MLSPSSLFGVDNNSKNCATMKMILDIWLEGIVADWQRKKDDPEPKLSIKNDVTMLH